MFQQAQLISNNVCKFHIFHIFSSSARPHPRCWWVWLCWGTDTELLERWLRGGVFCLNRRGSGGRKHTKTAKMEGFGTFDLKAVCHMIWDRTWSDILAVRNYPNRWKEWMMYTRPNSTHGRHKTWRWTVTCSGIKNVCGKYDICRHCWM